MCIRDRFYAAVLVGLAALVVWYFITLDFGVALTRMVTVLVIACPHALGLAIPLVTARTTSIAAENGLLIRRRQALETAVKATVVKMCIRDSRPYGRSGTHGHLHQR